MTPLLRANSGTLTRAKSFTSNSWRFLKRGAKHAVSQKAEEQLADTIAFAPVLFQRHIPAVADLRVFVIGERVFAASVDTSEGEYPQDVRMNLNVQYSPHELPPNIVGKIHALMRRLGLVYGALDFRLTPDGRYVFLEINPAGQFLYVEHNTGQKIAAALAEELATSQMSPSMHTKGLF